MYLHIYYGKIVFQVVPAFILNNISLILVLDVLPESNYLNLCSHWKFRNRFSFFGAKSKLFSMPSETTIL